MKIYVSGPHSSGKSTLVRYIANKYNLPMVFETARMILSENEQDINKLRCDLDTADKYQQQVFDRQLLEESKYPSFVSDRSALDVLAYSAMHTRILSKLMASPELAVYIGSLRAPDCVTFVVSPHSATLASDGIREAINWDSIVAISAQLKLLYNMFGLRYFQIDTANMSERARLIDNVLSLVK